MDFLFTNPIDKIHNLGDITLIFENRSNLQKAMKVLLNGCYGALANKYFRWYDANNAEAITTSGQLSIRWVAADLNEYMNKLFKTENEDYVIAIDTDSVYLTFDKSSR